MNFLLKNINLRSSIKINFRQGPLPKLKRFNIEKSEFKFPHSPSGSSKANENLQNSHLLLYHHIYTPMVITSPSFASKSLHFVNHYVKKNTFKVGFLIATLKAVGADIFAQKIIENSENLDYSRTGIFFCFGALYSGLILNFLYLKVYPKLFRTKFGHLNAFLSAAFDNFINVPFLMFPLLYALKSGGEIKNAMVKYREEAWEACVTTWKIWIPAHLVTFGLVPQHLRIIYVSCVSFIFFTVVSLQQRVFEKRREEEREAELRKNELDKVLENID